MSREANLKITASAVSRGTASGNAVCLYGKKRQFSKTHIDQERIDREIRRFRAATRLAARQLSKLSSESTNTSASSAGVLESHRLILNDRALLDLVEEKIRAEMLNAEWAVKMAADALVGRYRAIPDERFRERSIDVEDVAERILTTLGGGRRVQSKVAKGSVIVARELNPSTLIELSDSEPAGIVTEHGGWTSHTFILARELGIPAVTGVKKVLRRIATGDVLFVDGNLGEVFIRPEGEVQEHERNVPGSPKISASVASAECRTLDGREIIIRANADIVGGYEKAKAAGARGIGLYRSEYIFNRFRGVPGEREQYEAYCEIARLAGKDGIRIRTFDFGSDELGEIVSKNKNPALGLRAIRYSLEHEKQFRTQLRALLRASYQTNIDIILPMVSDISDIRKAKVILASERESLEGNDVKIGSPSLGVMIEVPSAVMLVDHILDEVDLLSLGTNDLVQYLLAVDRDNESVAGWFRTLSPAVIRAVKTVLDACSRKNKSCVVCGEMAGSPHYVPILIGLGALDLSMNPQSISRVKALISGITFKETVELVKRISNCKTAMEIEDINRAFIQENWSHLY